MDVKGRTDGLTDGRMDGRTDCELMDGTNGRPNGISEQTLPIRRDFFGGGRI